jgi:four helix bundle protein
MGGSQGNTRGVRRQALGEEDNFWMEKPHKRLDLWNAAMNLAIAIQQATNAFPSEERYGLTSQMRRAALSVPCNVAEGAARQTKKEFVNYLHMAQGSLSELDTQLEFARRVGYLGQEVWSSLDRELVNIDKMLSGLIRHQKKNTNRGGDR